MRAGNSIKLLVWCFVWVFALSSIASAEVLVMKLSAPYYTVGESARVYGYVLDDYLNGKPNNITEIYLDGSYLATTTTDSDGFYEYYITNLTQGDHNVSVNTSQSTQRLSFTVYPPDQVVSYQIIASTLTVPFKTPFLNLTIKKYIGEELTNQSYTLEIFYENGSLFNLTTGVSGVDTRITLPQVVGLYTLIIDGVKSFVVSVTKFDMKFRITDSMGNPKNIFKPGGIAYFEVEGYSNGQTIHNATVIARITTPSGTVRTIPFTEVSGVYKGNTNLTMMGTPLTLVAGDYEIEFVMKDSANNEQKMKGFFTVLGLSVDVDLVDKRAYRAGELMEFDAIVRNLVTGELLNHSDVDYTLELEKDGKLYDSSFVSVVAHPNPGYTSKISFTVPTSLEDGNYLLKVRANSDGKLGKAKEFFKIQNTDFFVKLSDTYDWPRDFFQPGELAKVTATSNDNISFLSVSIYDREGNFQGSHNTTGPDTTLSVTFNVPTTQAGYVAKVRGTVDGTSITAERWFSVQKYFSYLDVKDLNFNHKISIPGGEDFFAEIWAFDIATGDPIDISNFVIKFDRIVNEETLVQYTNIKANENSTYSDRSNGRVVFRVTAMNLPNGPYRIEYTLVDSTGDSFKGKGWFVVSDLSVDVATYTQSGQKKDVFSVGESVNVTVDIGSGNGTATIHREFFPPKSFSIVNGHGSTLLTSASGELPSEPGWYPFGVDVELDTGERGMGDGFFEIRNLNFRSINVRKNGEFSTTDNIVVDVVIEKTGELVNGSNVTLERLVRASDLQELSATSVALPTDAQGRTILNITPTMPLTPGDYFADIKAQHGNDIAFGGFGFRVVGDQILITIDDDDRIFSQTETIDINVKVTDKDNNPKAGVVVNLIGLMNLDTWAPVPANREANTSTNGIATLTISAANYNPARYAPIINISTTETVIVGFGEGEFEIVPFDANVDFSDGLESFYIGEPILVDVNVVGTVTVECTVKDMFGNEHSVDYYYSDGVLTVNNDLEPGEYFLVVTITSGSKSQTKQLWFEVLAPWAMVTLTNDVLLVGEPLNFSYTIFTFGANGWHYANATLIIKEIENLWTGAITPVNISLDAHEEGSGGIDLADYNLTKGDYMLRFDILENPDYEESLYFRLEKDVFFDIKVDTNNNNVTINVTAYGLSGNENYTLTRYFNFDTFTETSVDTSNTNGIFHLNGLDNGFYQAQIEIRDGPEFYHLDVHFDVRVREVDIICPNVAYMGEDVVFNITSSIDTSFWIIDPFTQTVLLSVPISVGEQAVVFNFPNSGRFIYSYGNDKWQAFDNGEEIEIIQPGFDVEWPMKWRYVLGDNLTFNVTTQLNNTPLKLLFKSHFTGDVTEVLLGNTPSVPNQKVSYKVPLNTLGPQDVVLILNVAEGEKPKSYFFVDTFPNRYDVWAWTDKWEYKAGETVTIKTDVYDILDDMRLTPDVVSAVMIEDPYGTDLGGGLLAWTPGDDFATIPTDDTWLTGNYHVQLNITKNNVSTLTWVDFFVRGNDDLQVNWFQNKWDLSGNDIFIVTVDVRDKGEPVAGVTGSLHKFETRPEAWDEEPVDVPLPSGSYYFSSPDNTTNSTGRLRFFINLSKANLASRGYTGRLNVGGQIVWFDFNLRNYQVEAYTPQWEYGITDTIEMNVRARDIKTWLPLGENGNVTILEIRRHEPGIWQPTPVPLEAFGLESNITDVYSGEALIEMVPNNSILQLDKPYEFEVVLEMNLESSGKEYGWGWFKLSNTEKPTLTIVDRTGEVPDTFFGGQTYTLQLTGPENMTATLRNLWGPRSRAYNLPMVNRNGTLVVNFTTPNEPGMYTLEVEVIRAGGFPEYMHKDFLIGSGTELNGWMMGNVIPGVNFTVTVSLLGEGEDPWCAKDPWCVQDWLWFGPLANKTIELIGLVDLSNFTYINLSNLGINATTEPWPDWMFGEPAGEMVDCGILANQADCEAEESCRWIDADGVCKDLYGYCNWFTNQTACESSGESCRWDPVENRCDYEEEPFVEEQVMQPQTPPGMAFFTLNPNLLGLKKGQRYDLVFSYTGEEGDVTHGKVFVQVEAFHVAISRNERNLPPTSEQQVWVKTTYLNGTPLPNCTINFTGIYDEKDFTLVKALDIDGKSDENGEFVFTYNAPSLPGPYLVEGEAVCQVLGQTMSQDLAYFIDVGSKNLKVDMKTKYAEDENIRIVITTQDRLSQPKPLGVELRLWHLRDNYELPIYPVGGVDCVALEAGPEDQWGVANNALWIETDESGHYELELCPLPRGVYDIEIFPMIEFMDKGPEGMRGEEDFGFFNSFIVSSIDVSIQSDYRYVPGNTVVLNITASDEFGTPLNGSIVALEAELELMGPENSGNTVTIHSMNDNLTIVNGKAIYNFTIPFNVTEDNQTINLSVGPVFIRLMIEDSEGNLHSFETMQFALGIGTESNISTPESAMTDSLLPVEIETDNLAPYKAQFGGFFMADNPSKEKLWMIENGVFFENSSGKSRASLKILTPKEPGNYLFGILILPLGASIREGIDPSALARELVITPVEIKLDSVNVSGFVKNLAGEPVPNALIKIGKAETFTDQNGAFAFEIPKGKKKVFVEKKLGELRHFMKTTRINFNESKVVNITLYQVVLSGELQQKVFNITSPGFDLSTTKLRIEVLVNNTGPQDLVNFSLIGKAMSGEEEQRGTVYANNVTTILLSKLYAGFEDGDYRLKIVMEQDNPWNADSYITVDGTPVNATVGAILEKEYTVETYATPGNGLDDDSDGLIDEEFDNNKDDDNDGRIDEDLMGIAYVEWCGNGFCSAEEFASGSCFEDCAVGDVCGDGFCSESELYNCYEDCADITGTCDNQGECNEDGTFCNSFGLREPADWCQTPCNEDNCWACTLEKCEAVGCTIGEDDQGNSFCFKYVECSADDCWACDTEANCTATGLCEWHTDEWGGWCERPWNCTYECMACGTEQDCLNSPATMHNTSCRWVEDEWGGWCEWNFSFLPPKAGGAGIIGNVWLAPLNTTPDINATADWNCWSGNCGSGLDAGDYFIMVDMGTTNVSVRVNGTEIYKINNFDGYWRVFASPTPYHFDNGTYDIEIVDLIGPDHLVWHIGFGVVPTPPLRADLDLVNQELGITDNSTHFEFTIAVENLSVSPICGGQLDALEDFEMWYVQLDSIPGEGCNLGEVCTGKEDYELGLESNATGAIETYFEFWNGTGLEEDKGVTVKRLVNCSQNWIKLWVELNAVNASPCEQVVVRFVTSYEDNGMENVMRTVDDNTYTVSGDCGTSNASLSGTVNGSYVINASVSLYLNGDQVATTLTNDFGQYSFQGLQPGVYEVSVIMPEGTLFTGMEVIVNNFNITGDEVMNVFVPHVFAMPYINGFPAVEGAVQVGVNMSANFSVRINNTEAYTVNATLEFNATDVGDAFYNTQSTSVLGFDIGELAYEFTPSLLGVGVLGYDLLMGIPLEGVIAGSPALINASLEVELSNEVLVNVTFGENINCSEYNGNQAGCLDNSPPCGWYNSSLCVDCRVCESNPEEPYCGVEETCPAP